VVAIKRPVGGMVQDPFADDWKPCGSRVYEAPPMESQRETMNDVTKRRPRLGVTGSAGVGKTSLGRRLAEILAVPFVEEGMRARIEAGLDMHTLDRNGRRALLLELFEQTLAAIRAAVNAGDGFVSDCCSIDFAAFWLYYGFGFDEDATQRVFSRAESALAGYDLIIVLPWGAIPLLADGVRSANPWIQLHYQVLLEGLLARHARPGQIVQLPLGIVGLEERLRWVRAHLEMVQ
jgi:nicotinamide riboside kinase